MRIPASFCGIYGIKPTQGRVARYTGAAAPVAANHLSQPGPMTRTVADSALLLHVMAGHDSREASGPAIVGRGPGYIDAVDAPGPFPG